MENPSSQLCATIDFNSFFAKKAVVNYVDQKIVIELSKRTHVISLVDIASIKIIKVLFFGGRIVCIKTAAGAVIALRISDYIIFEKFIRLECPNLAIQCANTPFWVTSLYLCWIGLVISYVPIMSFFSLNNSDVISCLLTYGSMYILSVPILLLLNLIVVRVVPIFLRKKWLLYLWLFPVFGFGIVSLNLMNKYVLFKDVECR